MNRQLTEEELKQIYQGAYVQQTLGLSPYRVERLLPYFNLKEIDIVADFACGSGLLAGMIHDRVAQYFGIDWSQEFIDVANKQMPSSWSNVTFQCADIVEFCAAHPQAFDKAFTLDFSEHIYDSDFLTIYRAIYESLKPQGILYLHTPNGRYFLELLKKKRVLKQSLGHVAVREAQEYKALLAQVGFAAVDIRYLPHYVRSLQRLHFLSYLPLVGGLFNARLFMTCLK
ncbi:MAG: methyltransferase domain-containing protein [Chloroflexi bacterium]|nr:methyltransferase domain-containing protein [Chloroflexota bacterium]MCI0644106.1 methyltransferase domain-containing protein [Chloroflexota bacterium]MCI0730681.1 methyltransferase domain-containing protein [Chloroflexota bacterium]